MRNPTEWAFLLLVFVLTPTLILVGIVNAVMMRRRSDPGPIGGWALPPPPAAAPMQITMLQGSMCTCGGLIQTSVADAATGQPAVLRCSACGLEGVVGSWVTLRERSL